MAAVQDDVSKTEVFQGKEIIRQKEIGKHLEHERGAGKACSKCGPACEGLDLHFWRKICKNCHCKYEDHDVKNEEELHHKLIHDLFDKKQPIKKQPVKCYQGDLKSDPTIGEDVKANFIQVPEVSSVPAMAKYLDAIPKEKAAHHDDAGAQHRSKQLAHQLPAHDFDDKFCDDLNDEEREKMQAFNVRRNEEAAGQGTIKENDQEVTKWVCNHCSKHLFSGEVAIFADRAGEDKCWHPKCFVCSTCEELLVDLIYFYKDEKIYCGRHYGELTRVRCAACDELIFTKEYTQAENQNWHIKHFCCFNCDKSLGGEKYVAREDKPYCMSCYESLFAKKCAACKSNIAADGKRVSYKDSHWHATEDCFNCVVCKKPMLGMQFIYKDESIFCTPACARK